MLVTLHEYSTVGFLLLYMSTPLLRVLYIISCLLQALPLFRETGNHGLTHYLSFYLIFSIMET